MNFIIVLFACESIGGAFIRTFNCPFSLIPSIVSVDDLGCTLRLRVKPVFVLRMGLSDSTALI